MFNADKLSSPTVPIELFAKLPYMHMAPPSFPEEQNWRHTRLDEATLMPLCSASLLLNRLPLTTSQCKETGFQELSWVHVRSLLSQRSSGSRSG